MTKRVAIIGGGVGGLCLAQGLKKAGVPVTVYERDRSRSDRLQGYRLHVNPHGAQALRDCLPPDLYRTFVETSGNAGGGFNFADHQLRKLLTIDPVEGHFSVSRITLRQIMLDGLEDVVRFDKQFERYDDGTLYFADGATETYDVLVGADGVNSKVRQQYLPHARVVDTGVTAIAGKLFLDEADWLPDNLTKRPNMIVAPSDCGMFLAPFTVQGVNDDNEGVLFDNTRPYLMWAYAAADLSVVDESPREIVANRIAGWSPDLVRVVRETHSDAVSWWPIRSSVPVDPWAPSTVTLLGDAIHSMTPMRGIGANTALRDARLLTLALTNGGDVVHAIGQYEERMRDYGYAAVRNSLRSAKQFAQGNVAARTMFKAVLRFAEAVPPVKRAMFAEHGLD
jgi:2-polyprenyl-6-methoxyphenol hydroxylase-like FAD-dependent oxidoreductase